jgi:hypothetical protein
MQLKFCCVDLMSRWVAWSMNRTTPMYISQFEATWLSYFYEESLRYKIRTPTWKKGEGSLSTGYFVRPIKKRCVWCKTNGHVDHLNCHGDWEYPIFIVKTNLNKYWAPHYNLLSLYTKLENPLQNWKSIFHGTTFRWFSKGLRFSWSWLLVVCKRP